MVRDSVAISLSLIISRMYFRPSLPQWWKEVSIQEIAVSTPQAASIMEVLNQNPDLAGQILKNLLLQTAYASGRTPQSQVSQV